LAVEQQKLGAKKYDGNVKQHGVEQEAESGELRIHNQYDQGHCGSHAEQGSPQ
jgi:hypothetical protein